MISSRTGKPSGTPNRARSMIILRWFASAWRAATRGINQTSIFHTHKLSPKSEGGKHRAISKFSLAQAGRRDDRSRFTREDYASRVPSPFLRRSFSLLLPLVSTKFLTSLVYDEQFSTTMSTVTAGSIRSLSRWLHVMLESRLQLRAVSAPSLSSSARRHRGTSSPLSSSNLSPGSFYEERNARGRLPRHSLTTASSGEKARRYENSTEFLLHGML